MMRQIFQRVLLSLLLLASGGLVLLLGDLHSRTGGRKPGDGGTGPIPVAILKHASNRLLDDVEQGVLDQLAADGYKDGEALALQRFCAESDLPTANSIAKRIADGSFTMAISISTLSLQCLANANKDGRVKHVFGAVTDPAGAGVGIQRMNSTNKPPWLAGFGTFQPVEQIFREARRLWPGLKKVGVIWNPSERNSETCTLKAREICRELGIQLLEANVEQSKDVREAADSLVARGVEAFWTGADITVNNATAALCDSAMKGKIPVFSNTSGQVREGTLFDLGANYIEVGHSVGKLASSILRGLDPASVVISNYMPERIMLNRHVLKALRDPWKFPADLEARADLVVGVDGGIERGNARAAATQPAVPVKTVRIGMAYFGPDEGTDSAISGLMDGLGKLGIMEGRNLVVRKVHANGEVAGIPAMLQALDASEVDVIVPFSTPVITAACAGVRHKPVVFTYCFDPVAAGAGKSFEEHLPFITGIGSFPPVEEALEMIRLTFPKLKRLGTLYNNAEANSVKVVSVLRRLCTTAGIELVEVPANGTSEVVPAAQSLVARGVEAVYLPGDNTAYQAFDGLASRLNTGKVPLIIDAPEFLHRGALAVVGVGYYQSGFAAAEPLARVLAGESPGSIPLRNVTEKQILLNMELARRMEIHFPPAVLAMQTGAKQAAPPATKPISKGWRIALISYMESTMVEDATRGFADGLRTAGFSEGREFVLKSLCAQGDMANIGPMYDSAKTSGVDLYVALGTPSLQAGVRKAGGTPLLFTVVADPRLAGAGTSDEHHLPNVTGIHTQGPYREMAELLRTHFPRIKHIGTLFCPAEINSVANKDLFVREAQRCGLKVETVAANTSGELSDAALALCGRGLDAVVQITDNLSVAGFTTIARSAAQSGIPLFACHPAAIDQGACIALARDYYQSGLETAKLAVRVMRGESPANIPFAPLTEARKLVNPSAAAAAHLTIPEALLREAQTLDHPKKQ